MKTKIIAISIIGLTVIVLGVFFNMKRSGMSEDVIDLQNIENEAVSNKIISDEKQDVSNSGMLLAGDVSQYREFSKQEYDRAIRDGKVVFLNFWANWCPICRSESAEIVGGFNSLNNPNVIGFRVNFKDDETDDDEKALAQEFGITYQHSKVIIKNGESIYRQIAEQWDREKVIAELGSI